MSTNSDDFGFDSDDGAQLEAALLQRGPWLETPLRTGDSEIRILRLHKGDRCDPMTCSLLVVSLDRAPVYETLSYVWGDPSRTKTILVSGTAFEATVNLFNFLYHLRLEGADRLLWADAICIDQSSEEEKRDQLRLMTEIYLRGTRAHIWFGAFTASWSSEIPWDDGRSVPTSDLRAEEWECVESVGRNELGSFVAAGGLAPDRDEYLRSRDGSLQGVFAEALDVLDGTAAGRKMHEFPLYLRQDDGHVVNRHWVTILDCIRWIITRSWWSRVWTYQEAILPPKDSVIHTTSHSFFLSKVLDSIHALSEEVYKFKRKIKYTTLFWAAYQRFPDHYFDRVNDLQRQRMAFLNRPDNKGLNLASVIRTTQGREATEVRDHFFGIFAVLPPDFQRWWLETSKSRCLETAAQIFAQCTKDIFFSGETASLKSLSEAIGVREMKVPGLPSWAIDLSASLPATEDVNSRWDLYDACADAEPPRPISLVEQLQPHLRVEGIPIATLRSTSQFSLGNEDDVLELGKEWLSVFCAGNPHTAVAGAATDDDASNGFWRTAFMDRDVWRYWLHTRQPLPAARLADISAWWAHYVATGDHRDLTPDRSLGDGRRGNYHFRALLMNMTVQRFFTTAACGPGLGPHGVEPGDQVFVLKGHGAPVVLRRVAGRWIRGIGDGGTWRLVGSCFVDRYMYGEAVRADARGTGWRVLALV